MSTFKNRIIRALKLEADLYEEVEADTSSINQALAIVVLSSVAGGIGAIGKVGFAGLFLGIFSALCGWAIWAYLTYLIGTKLLPEAQTQSDPVELMRTIGFSSAPGLLRVIGILPGLYGVINIIASIWMLIAMVIAVRQALDYTSTSRAVLVCIIGWIAQALVIMILLTLFA